MQLSEHELAVCAQRGDLDAYGELVRCHQSGVFSVCYRMLGERGEEDTHRQVELIRSRWQSPGFKIFPRRVEHHDALIAWMYLCEERFTADLASGATRESHQPP